LVAAVVLLVRVEEALPVRLFTLGRLVVQDRQVQVQWVALRRSQVVLAAVVVLRLLTLQQRVVAGMSR